jgi:hypothetical protein
MSDYLNQYCNISKQEGIWLRNICDELFEIHEKNSEDCTDNAIHHYCCFVPHGRSKSCREKGGLRKKQF